MSWLDKLIGGGNRGRARGPNQSPAAAIQPPRQAVGTIVRADATAVPTLAKPGMRFPPDHEVSADLQIKTLLGSGGMGEVYLARQRLWDVDVALKIPTDKIVSDPDTRHRIVREAEAWTDLGLHPHVAYCYYAQPLGELLLLVVEYVDGGNLRGWIADGRCADLKTGLDLAIQFCHGLEHAHKKGLVHRDIKPENVLLMQDGTLKITDFGIARMALASPETLESNGAGLKARVRKRFKVTTNSDHDQPVAPNLLDRHFTAETVNQRWVGDTTEFVIGESGKLYLAAILDCSRDSSSGVRRKLERMTATWTEPQ